MKSINFIIIFFLFSLIYSKGGGGGHGGGGHGSSGHSSSSSSGRSSSRSSTSSNRRVGSLRNGVRIRFTSSGRYGRSKLWFSNHYVNIHYIGHHNYYNESDYNEENYNELNENIYLLYVINGTFLNNHINNSFYKIDGHYITFSEYSALADFLQNITEFVNIFGNETKIIMSKNFLINNNNSINTSLPSIVEFIDENIYQKVMIDVVTDVHDVPFYKLFPDLYIDNILYFLSFISPIIIIVYPIYFYCKYNYKFAYRDFYFYHLLIFLLMFFFINEIDKDFNMRNNYIIYLYSHKSNIVFFIFWQIIQLFFIFHLVSYIIEKNVFLRIGICFIIVEYFLINEIGSILILLVFLKIIYFGYSIFALNNYRKTYLDSVNYVELSNIVQQKEIFIKKINIIFSIIILLIIFELLLLVYNGAIFYSIQFNFFLLLCGVFFFEHFVNNDTFKIL